MTSSNKIKNNIKYLQDRITAGEAWDLAHMMAQVFAYEGEPTPDDHREVELPLFSSMEFERDEDLQPSVTLIVSVDGIEWIYETIGAIAHGTLKSPAEFFKAFGIEAGKDEYTVKFKDFMFTQEQVDQLRAWAAEDHPYLDDDVELRDYLFLLLMERLDLVNQPEPYNCIIFDWLKL